MSTLGELSLTDSGVARRADVLNEAMIAALREMGAIRGERVEEVFRAVRRHRFAPGASLEQAYTPTAAVPVKCDEHGVALSTVSAPQLQAFMLEQAGLEPGMTALEIGAGGPNAAMMAWLVGPAGSVTTVDIDPEVTERARRLLDAAGYSRVNVVCADAEDGVADHAPFDRIIVTAGAWDIPPAWVAQLAPGGRLVVPLRMRGLTRLLALDRDGDHLVSRSAERCGFVPMQGAGAHAARLLELRGQQMGLRFDDGWPGGRRPVLDGGVVDSARAQAWSGVTIGDTESFETLQLWLASSFPGSCRLAATAGQDGDLVDVGGQWFDVAAVEGDSFGYLVTRRAGVGLSEFGTHAFGPRAGDIAEAMAEQVRVWDRDRRGGAGPEFAVWPFGTPGERLPAGLVINKRHVRVTISWPAVTGQHNPRDREPEQ